MNTVKVSNAEAICLILVIFMNHLILSMPQTILRQSGSSSILSVLYIICIAFFFVWFISKLMKPFINQDIIDIADYLGGKILKWTVGIISLLYLIIISSALIRDFTDFIKLVHFSKFPTYFILFFLLLLAVIGNFFGRKATFRTNLIIIPIVAVGLLITFCSVIPNYTFERIFPIWGNGLNQTFLVSLSNLSAFGGLFFLFFLKPMLKENNDFAKVGKTSVLIMGFFLLLAITSLLLAFPFSTQVEELSPLYYITSITGSTTFFQRPESIFMLTWILAIMSYITIMISFCFIIIKKFSKISLSKGISIPIAIVIYILALIPPDIAIVRKVQEVVYNYSSIGVVMIFFLVILLFAYIKQHKKQKQTISVDEEVMNE